MSNQTYPIPAHLSMGVPELRQVCRNEFTAQLRKSFPHPEDPTRQQVEPMLDDWWPDTVEQNPELWAHEEHAIDCPVFRDIMLCECPT